MRGRVKRNGLPNLRFVLFLSLSRFHSFSLSHILALSLSLHTHYVSLFVCFVCAQLTFEFPIFFASVSTVDFRREREKEREVSNTTKPAPVSSAGAKKPFFLSHTE